jgi:hypothetical protein
VRHRREDSLRRIEQPGPVRREQEHDVARGAVQRPHEVAGGEGGVDDAPVDDLDGQVEAGGAHGEA